MWPFFLTCGRTRGRWRSWSNGLHLGHFDLLIGFIQDIHDTYFNYSALLIIIPFYSKVLFQPFWWYGEKILKERQMDVGLVFIESEVIEDAILIISGITWPTRLLSQSRNI